MYDNFNLIKSNKQELLDSFMKGDTILSDALLEKIFFDMFPESNKSYFETVKTIKGYLNEETVFRINNVAFISLPEEAKEEEKAVAVRFINLQKKTSIVAINSKIAYVIDEVKEEGIESVNLYVNNLIVDYEKKLYMKNLGCRIGRFFVPVGKALGWLDEKKDYLCLDTQIEKSPKMKSFFAPPNKLKEFAGKRVITHTQQKDGCSSENNHIERSRID